MKSLCRCGRSLDDFQTNHFDIIIPLFKSRELIASANSYLNELQRNFPTRFRVYFVVDGDIDGSFLTLKKELSAANYRWKIIVLARNFGVGPAIMAGLSQSNGCIVTAIGIDLQEPPSLLMDFLNELSDESIHVALGVRKSREDPFFMRFFSGVYWRLYRRFISPSTPIGGFDAFAMSQVARSHLILLKEKSTNITAQIDWLGFTRKYVKFDRIARKTGKSTWTFSRKVKLFMDSFYGFTDLPIRIMLSFSGFGFIALNAIGIFTVIARLLGLIELEGYTTIVFLQIYSLNILLLAISIVAGYITRAFENSQGRPIYIVQENYEPSNWRDDPNTFDSGR